MNIIITGVNGLLGYEVAKLFLENKNNHVYGVSRSMSQFNVSNYYHINKSIEDDTFIDNLPEVCDIIIHLAQSEHFRIFPEKARNIFDVNIRSTQLLLDYAYKAKCRQFIYTSSGGIYGEGHHVFSENKKIFLNSDIGYYLSSKLIGELLAMNYRNYFIVKILRPFFIFGERQRKTMLIPRLIEQIKNGTPIKINEQGGIKINPIYVQDAARAILEIIKTENSDIYNICGNQIMSIKEICEKIGQQLNLIPLFKLDANLSNNDIIGDNRKLKEMGFEYQYTFNEGIKRMIINSST